jgi:uncharacterized protein YgiB involved in biofilm formation
MPLLMGYMIGNMMSGPRYAQPVYRDRDNNAVTPGAGGSGAYRVGTFSGTGSGAGTAGGFSGASAGRATFQPAAQVTQVSRGGFGSTASRFSGTSGG